MSDEDAYFGPPFIDVDEWRDEPVRHRYVHGGFADTQTLFSLYFPPPERYDGRILQFLEGGTGGSEHVAPGSYGFEMAGEIGALLIESNQGHVGFSGGGDIDTGVPESVRDWRASAETIRVAKYLAAEFYGAAPNSCYLYGASGGAVRTVAAIEAAPGLWDGAVAAVINRAPLHLFNWSVHALAALALDGLVADVVDATDAGGSGDPFAVLRTDAQRHALATLYRAGFCRGAESQLTANPFISLALKLHRMFDPGFSAEFWGGVEAGAVVPLVTPVERTATVQRLVSPAEMLRRPDWEDISRLVAIGGPAGIPAGLVLDVELTNAQLCGANLSFITGGATGRAAIATGLVDGACVAALEPGAFEGVGVGDRVEIDNRELVAFAHYHRYLADPTLPPTRQFVVDGRPVHEPRAAARGLPVPSGRFEGKLVLVQNAADRECWPNALEPLVGSIRSAFGDRTDDVLRVWWMANAAHHPPLSAPGSTRLVSWAGMVAQAVADVVDWVEGGVAPPASTSYVIGPDEELLMPETAAERLGVQPVVTVTADGRSCARIGVGETVNLAAVIEVPPGAGAVVSVEWDLEGAGTWAESSELSVTTTAHRSELTHAYDEPGTFFVTCRAASHRDGPESSPVRRVDNLGRARVVVS